MGKYEESFALLTPAVQQRVGPLEEWVAGVETSLWVDLTVETLGGTADAPTLDVTLATEQDEDGERTCTIRTMTYTFIPSATAPGPSWLIDAADEHSTTPCVTW